MIALSILLCAACGDGQTGSAANVPAPVDADGGAWPATPIDGPSTLVTADLLQTGRASYAMWCAHCHGSSGRGDGADAEHLDPPPRDQSDSSYMNQLSDRDIAETILFGGAPRGYPGMPSLPSIFGDELVAVVAYVRSLSRDPVEAIALTADTF